MKAIIERDHVVYTGLIDAYFDYRFGKLPYRSVHFEHQHLSDVERFQATGTANYPNDHDLNVSAALLCIGLAVVTVS